jgi:hypothetical protein
MLAIPFIAVNTILGVPDAPYSDSVNTFTKRLIVV